MNGPTRRLQLEHQVMVAPIFAQLRRGTAVKLACLRRLAKVYTYPHGPTAIGKELGGCMVQRALPGMSRIEYLGLG